jgi:TonB family protein
MTQRHARVCTTVGLIAWLALSPARAGAQDSIAEAKKLYQSADYDAALGVLDRLKNDTTASADPDFAPYRVLCLLALGRNDEAQRSIETILRQNPRYRPSETETSPRIRAVFEDARRRLLPQIFQERYDTAKAAFERKDFQSAADQFRSLVSLLDDPTLKTEDSRADLRIVVSAFSDLAEAAVTTQKPASAAAASASPAPLELAAAAAPARIYVGGAGVVPPVAISKPLPPFPRGTAMLRRDHVGVLDIVVNEEGNVSEVTVRKSVHPQFDKKLVETVRTWKFRPATKDGHPVSFRSVFEVKLVP